MRAFTDNLVLILQAPVKGIKSLMEKWKDFDVVAGFNINNQKTKIFVKNMTLQDQDVSMKKIWF